MWARRRQLLILTVFFILVGFSIYASLSRVVLSGPTCSDGLRNQGELGADCGGPCAKVCSSEVAPLSIIWTKVFKVSTGSYDVAALVENRNLTFAARTVSYSFKVYDAANLLIAEQKGSTYANPKQQFLVFAPNIDVGKRVPYRAFIELGTPDWQRLAPGVTNSLFDIENKLFVGEPSPRVSAEVINRSLRAISSAEAYVVLSDAKGNAFAVSKTNLTDLVRGARNDVVFTWPEKFQDEPALIDILVRTK